MVEVPDRVTEIDQIFIATRLKNVLKRAKGKNILTALAEVLAYPFDAARQITIPPPNYEVYDKNKLALIPLTCGFTFFFLMG